jgi:hypothetical protein
MTLAQIRADMDKMLKLAVSAYHWNDDVTLVTLAGAWALVAVVGMAVAR